MNVSELARQLHVHPQKLLQVLPEFGFDIGVKAVKIDDRVAQQIQREWRRIKFILEQREKADREKEKLLEKEMRKSSGITISIPPKITVREFSEKLNMPINKVIMELMKNGILAAQNENIDHDTAVIIAQELGFSIAEESSVSSAATEDNEHVQGLELSLTKGALAPRPPIIVVMGHVDHGKTKLLDAIRKTNVVDTESGGITQHIGAYQVFWKSPNTKEKSLLTFIDTPGHEAFTVMRSRGAKVADIAILVVAADDSVKPQTVEAINIIKAAKLPFLVAINKIDKPGADVQRVRSDLSQHGITPEEWGGDIPMVEISAKQNLNIDKLLDTLLVIAEMNQTTIKADPNRPAAGTVIEAHMDKGAGPVATVLVQTGTLHLNDPLIVNGEIYGKARALRDYRGENMETALPSCPARILGFKIAPQVGDVLDLSREIGAARVDVRGKKTMQTGAEKVTTTVTGQEDEESKRYLNIVIKADTLGSLEAIIGSLENIKNPEVGVKIIGKGLGNVTADDISLAETSSALVFGFHVNANSVAMEMVQKGSVQFLQYKIIYDLLDKVKLELEKMLNPEVITTELGNFKVVALFRTEKNHMVVGGRVESGKLYLDSKARVKRGGELIGIGRITKLQSGRQEVKEVPAGSECGVQFDGKLRLEVGDVIESYREDKKEKKLVLS